MSRSIPQQIRTATEAEFRQLLPVLLAQLPEDERRQKQDFFLKASSESMAPWCREPHATRRNFLGGLLVARSESAALPQAIIWAHPAPGKTIQLGKPQLLDWANGVCEIGPCGPGLAVRLELVRHAVTWADKTGCEMLQVVAEIEDHEFHSALEQNGINKLVDLVYLSSPLLDNTAVAPLPKTRVQFDVLPPREENLMRWYSVIESTYLDSRDCPALSGHRSMSSIVSGYRATGTEWQEGWVILRSPGSPSPVNLPNPSNTTKPSYTDDLGCFVLADHPANDFVELVYFGLAPAARGQGLGLQILAAIEASARKLGRSRIIAAVDRKNLPALRVYAAANYDVLEERSVFARFFTV